MNSEMTYDFDRVIDRAGTNSIKLGYLKEEFGRDDLTALWVADMDFATPQFIIDALRQRLEHPILGYSRTPAEYWTEVSKWVYDHHGWRTDTSWYAFIPGIVKGIGMVINRMTQPTDKIIIQTPVYHPFRLVPEGNGRELVFNPLRETADGGYEMDFENLEQVCDEHCRLLILCNPHNPAGIVWPADTLRRLAHFAVQHNLIVISDEIHCDLALFGHRHTPFATVSEEAAQCSITFQAPTKTFNMAGVVSSYCIVPNEQLRRKFNGWLEVNEFDYPPMFSTIATLAAFREGEEWRRQMLSYVEGNILFVEEFVKANLPQLRVFRPQASFLVWLDCRALGMPQADLVDLFVNKARLALNDGAMFGAGGEGHMRLNVGCPRSVLQQALQQLASVMP